MRTLVVLILSVFTVAYLVGCGPSCANETAAYVDRVDDIMARWDDAKDVAGVTPALNLNGPISNLQAIRQEAAALEPPDCGELSETALSAKGNLLRYMDSVVSAINLIAGMATSPGKFLPIIKENMLGTQ